MGDRCGRVGRGCGAALGALVLALVLAASAQAALPSFPGGGVRVGSIPAGEVHSCGIKPDGTATCWGDNSFGQAGAPAGAFTAIAAGWFHSCGIKTDGTA